MSEKIDRNATGAEMAMMHPNTRAAAMRIRIGDSGDRGFRRYLWRDRYGVPCRLSKSSLAFEDCIWLGVNEECMHLTRRQARELVPLLQHFVKTGELP